MQKARLVPGVAAQMRSTSPARLRWRCPLGSLKECHEYELLWEIGGNKGHVLPGPLGWGLFGSSVAGSDNNSVFRAIQPYSSPG